MAEKTKTMKSLAIFKYSEPAGYQLAELPVPEIREPNQVLIKVHAGALNTGSTQIAAGDMKLFSRIEFPHMIGIEGAGVVAAVGSQVTKFSVGDEVYGCNIRRPVFPPPESSFCSEYSLSEEDLLLPKPPHLSFEEAASLLSSAVTAYQAVRKTLELLGVSGNDDDADALKGKTIFVPGALSSTGSMAVQLLKNVFGAARVVSTVSTGKMGLVDSYVPGAVDELIDYQTQDPVRKLGRRSVDVVLNTQWDLVGTFPLVRAGSSGAVVSIASMPTASTMRDVLGPGQVPFWMAWVLGLAQLWYRFRLLGTGVRPPVFVSGNPACREDLEAVGELIARQKIRAVYQTVDLHDIEAVRKECQKIRTGKGGIGKLVIRVRRE